MGEWMEVIQQGVANLSIGDQLLLLLNAIMLLFSMQILNLFDHSESGNEIRRQRLHIFRAVNLLLLLLILFSNFFPHAGGWVTRLISLFLVGYGAFLGFHLLDYLIKKRFGRDREVDGRTVLTDTYTSRVLSLTTATFVIIVALIAVVRILGFDSLLEAGGVIGFVGVFLALTQGSWAPDIIGGLIILNSRLMEEGDVVEFIDNGNRIYGMVFKTKVFHTEVLDLVNNHRIMLQNSRLRSVTLNNLSKFASARGLREQLTFNIGYEVPESRVQALFQSVFDMAVQNPDISIEANHPLQLRAMEAGDYAVAWSLFYYTKDVRNLPRTRQQLRARVIQQAGRYGISLATPLLHQQVGEQSAREQASTVLHDIDPDPA